MALCDEDFDVNCDECYEVSRSDSSLTFTALLTPETQYYLFVMDKFRNVDPVLITTDGNGSFTIDPSNAAYKDGMFNEYAGDFEVFIATDSSGTNVVELTFYGTAYNCVILTITSSTEINCTQTDQNQCLPSFVSDSDGIHELGENEEYTCISCGACDDATQVIKDSAGTILYTNSIPSGTQADQGITDSDLTVNNAAVKSILSEDGYNLVVELDGTPAGTWNGGNSKFELDSATDLVIKMWFAAGDDTATITIDSDSAGIVTAKTDDGSSGDLTYSYDGGGYDTFANLQPLTLVTTKILIAKRTIDTSEGWSRKTGTY